ncbi:immunity 53 family protein [Dyadobacter sp. 32]|uniref:immunity 53 family protein n=1 Tax=Dyadobacter sp. 32 TaxID=538966 RepID=UPI0011EC0F1E
MNTLDWIQDWYKSQCDGDWEHQYGLKITTIDNPGWYVEIDLIYTKFQDLEIENQNFDKTEDDWYGFRVKQGKFEGFGDPNKLEHIILKFKEVVESKSL